MYKRDLALLKSTYGALRLCRPTNDSPCTAQLKKKRPFCWIMTCEKANAGDQQPALQRRNLRDLAQHFTKIRPGLDQVDGVHLMDVVPLHVLFSKRKKFVKRRPGVSAKKKVWEDGATGVLPPAPFLIASSISTVSTHYGFSRVSTTFLLLNTSIHSRRTTTTSEFEYIFFY